MKSILSENKIENISVEKINNELFDFRDDKLEREDKHSEEFEHLKTSIQKQGLLAPINVTPSKRKNGSYLLVDGRRRFAAIQQLGLKTVPAIIITNKSENDLAMITLTQNIHRKDLKAAEKTKAIIKVFEMNGYNVDDVMSNTIKLNNQDKAKKLKEIDIKFINIVESLGFSVSYITTLVQVYKNLPRDIFEKAEEAGLSTQHKQLLTHKPLRKYPELQRTLVEELKDIQNYDDARKHVEKYERNIEIGAYKKDEATDQYDWDKSKLETNEPEVVPSQTKQYLGLMQATEDFLDQFTDYARGKNDDHDYTKEHIKYSEQFRRDIIDNTKVEELLPLRYNLVMIQHVIKSTIDYIEKKHPEEF